MTDSEYEDEFHNFDDDESELDNVQTVETIDGNSVRVSVPRGAKGNRRSEPCMACVNSMLAGRSDGLCFNVRGAKKGSRCWKCSSGHSCKKTSSSLLRAARRLSRAIRRKDKSSVSFLPYDLKLLTSIDDQQTSYYIARNDCNAWRFLLLRLLRT